MSRVFHWSRQPSLLCANRIVRRSPCSKTAPGMHLCAPPSVAPQNSQQPQPICPSLHFLSPRMFNELACRSAWTFAHHVLMRLAIHLAPTEQSHVRVGGGGTGMGFTTPQRIHSADSRTHARTHERTSRHVTPTCTHTHTRRNG